MSGHTPIRMILPHASQPRRDGLFCHIGSGWRLCHPPSTLSPASRSITWAGGSQRCGSAESAVHPPPLSLLSTRRARQSGFPCRPVIWAFFSVPPGKYFHREPSLPYFPCSPSITRSVLLPRPAALGVLLRLRRPPGLGFQRKITPKEQSRFFFGASTERHAFGTWERGTLASLRAGVSRGQSGQIQTGEKQWHSTKTKSR